MAERVSEAEVQRVNARLALEDAIRWAEQGYVERAEQDFAAALAYEEQAKRLEEMRDEH
jgi:hypothetical protein